MRGAANSTPTTIVCNGDFLGLRDNEKIGFEFSNGLLQIVWHARIIALNPSHITIHTYSLR